MAYDGSFFRNNIPTLVWANPSLAADSATLGPASGRMSMWPNTDSNTVSASVGTKLPGHSNANAYVSMATLSGARRAARSSHPSITMAHRLAFAR